MKLVRVMLVLLMVLTTFAPVMVRTAGAAGATAVVSSGDEGTPGAVTGSAPGTDEPGRNGKAGVVAAVGCGFAVASLILVPNPLSAFVVGFNCGLMFIDAVETPDR